MATEKLRKHKTFRNTCLSEMQILGNIAERAKQDSSLRGLFKVRCTELDNIREEFNKQHASVVGVLLADPESDLSVEDTIREGFLSEFFVVKAIYAELFDHSGTHPSNSAPANDSFSGQSSNIRLPKIELIKFHGDYTTFSTYIDLFDALVHNNSTLGNIEKFNYLISSLQGGPLSLVRTLPITESNYTIAYDTLVDRYSNKRLRAQAHWSEIENTQKINTDIPAALRKLLDVFSENLAALRNLKFPVDSWDFILVMMLLKRLDSDTATRFELEHGSSEVPTYDALIAFLKKRCIALDTLSFATPSSASRKLSSIKAPNKTNSFFAKPTSMKCNFCKEGHQTYNCSEFLKKSPAERYKFCKSVHLCFNCLSNVHQLNACKSLSNCRYCSRRHHSVLCLRNSPNSLAEQPQASNTNTHLVSDTNNDTTINSTLVHAATEVGSRNSGVLLSTATLEIQDSQGYYRQVRGLLDSGSMTSFISEKIVNRLGLRKTNASVEVKGLGTMSTVANCGSVTLNVRPVGQSSPTFCIDAIILTKICDNLPTSPISFNKLNYLSNLRLADSSFGSPGNIDMLLGADIFSQIILDGRISGNGEGPDALNTVFGYVVMGKIGSSNIPSVSSFLCIQEDDSFNNNITKFWDLENVPEVYVESPDDQLCEKIFTETVRRDDTGRFIVSLPFRDVNPSFPGSRSLALHRFYSLERRLVKQPQLYSQYCNFMREYLELKHMEQVDCNDISTSIYYLPHSYVLKPESSTTKLRVVFNASAKSVGKTSLNDHLFTGPKLQNDICTILMNFRLHKYVFCADLKQMYRMILIDPKQRDFQRIVWRFSQNEPIKDYRLCTVVYGERSSPYLALRTLIQLANDDGRQFPLAATAIRHDTYIDDIVTGSSSLEAARNLKSELISLFGKAGFSLRKWSSNEPQLLSDLPASHLSMNPLCFDEETDNSSLKILGLQWNPANDHFAFSVQPLERPCTKRAMLSELARVFDPLGFLTPLTFFTKHLIQRLWISGMDWDDPPNNEILLIWSRYISELHLLSSLQFPRHIVINDHYRYELHGFSDSSEKGYAAVIYFRVISNSNEVSTSFVCSKSKVAPYRQRITIARLELCAAVLLAQLVSFVTKVYENKITFSNIVAWSDSQVTLAWIKSSPHRWKTFIANRITIIQEKVSPANWFYVDTKLNPADAASRGLFPSQLLTHDMWFTGPPFLRELGDSWSTYYNLDNAIIPEEEQRQIVLHSVHETSNFIELLLSKSSSFSLLQRRLAYILRFIKNIQHPAEKQTGPLHSSELYKSLEILVKHTQLYSFENEFKNDSFSKPLRKLNVFLDDKGILRVGGRLVYSSLSYDKKHPILLPRRSHLTHLLIDYYHKKFLHVGLRTVQFLLAQQFWILAPRRAIRSVLAKCLTCWKTQPRNYQPPMGNLPPSRISQCKPFSQTGVDFAGPLHITMKRGRGNKTTKAYICIFVCFATKAIHVELASDLSSDVFLAALQRFIARRGRCERLISDCGTNFQGANKQLIEFMKDAASKESISWSFHAPGSPHFGGLWERGVKSIKSHLARVVGQQILSYEELYTVLVLIEAVLNSRPLTPISADPNDFSVLTPGHFLTLEPLTAIPTPNWTSTPLNRLSRFQLIQRIHCNFWDRFRKEYLHTLQQRSKWIDPPTPVKPGTLVLIKNDQTPPLQWPRGRIKTLYPGADNVARVAVVETAHGTFRRPLVKLCPLPISQDD